MVCLYITPLWPFLCIYISLSVAQIERFSILKDLCNWLDGTHLDNPGPSLHLRSLILITSAKSLLPQVPGIKTWMSFREKNILLPTIPLHFCYLSIFSSNSISSEHFLFPQAEQGVCAPCALKKYAVFEGCTIIFCSNWLMELPTPQSCESRGWFHSFLNSQCLIVNASAAFKQMKGLC